jgi:hypothetical protein
VPLCCGDLSPGGKSCFPPRQGFFKTFQVYGGGEKELSWINPTRLADAVRNFASQSRLSAVSELCFKF